MPSGKPVLPPAQRRAASALTYGILVGLIAVVALAGVTGSGGAVNRLFGTVSDRLLGVAPAGTPGAPARPECAPAQILSYTGATQTVTIPTGCTRLLLKLWGAGGSGAGSDAGTGIGGTGAFVSAEITVTPGEALTIFVGQGGRFFGNNDGYIGHSGGGRTEVARGGTPLAIAGAGGSGPARANANGGPGGCTTGVAGEASPGYSGAGGGGGTQSAGGSGGTFSGGYRFGGGNVTTASWPNGGRDSTSYGPGGPGGGGDGHYGGGSGGSGYGSGGGGSSLVPSGGSCSAGTRGNATPPGSSDPDYAAGIAVGGAPATSGGAGRVVFRFYP